jgi:alpha-L-rhamnosidase
VQAHPGNPVRIDRTFTPIKITEPKPHVYVFDLGQNMVGWAKFQFHPTPNKPVVVRYSEMLNADGTPYTVALRSARATDTYVPKSAAAVTWEPAFTFHGFRYIEITGLDYKPVNDAVTGIVAHTQLDQTGEFACSNKLVNQLFHNIIWGQKGNYLEVPTDCPQRDERLGWTGDAQFFARTGSYNMDVAAFFTKWLVDLVEDSQMKSGGYTHVAPSLSYDDGGGTAWQDAAPICTYTMYRFYGDTRIIQQHWASLSRYMDYLHNTSKDLIRNDKPFGDWLNLGGGAKSEVIGTAYYAYIARIMSEMAAAIDNKEDAAKYAKLADDIKQKFAKEFVAADGSIKESSQTGYALAYTMDLIPNELKTKAADHFAEEIRKKDWHLATGFIGTPRLLPSLTLAGRTELAYRLLLTDTFPSWLYPVTLGSTTMWERWDGWRPDAGFQNPGMNSFNHYAFGSVGEWLYATVAGIQTDGPGFRKIIIHPAPSASLQWARGKFHSINGIISSEWSIENGRLTMNVEIPPNTTATVYVPTPDPTAVTESGRLAKASPGIQYLRAEKGCAIYKAVSGHYTFSAPL